MKNIMLAALSALSVSVFAQTNITITEAPAPMSKGTQPSFYVEIPGATSKQVEKSWTSYAGKGSKGKSSNTNGEYLQTGAVNANVSPKPFNVYVKLLETTGNVRLTVWLTPNDTLFFSKANDSLQYMAIEKYIRDFAVGEYANTVKGELKAEEDKQKALDKELNGLIKEEEKSAKKISDSKRSIEKSNQTIADNNKQIGDLDYKIIDQKGMVERTASDANANKGAKQTLKDLENNRKRLQKDNDTQNKNIESQNKTIRDEERNTAAIQEKIKNKKDEIEKQKATIKEVQAKLDGIR
ncbi:MAG: hypothetical protein RLZZ367_1761 [Bacteroidota bacterium]